MEKNLLKAIKSNYTKAVQEMVSKNPELIKGKTSEESPLWTAAVLGHHEIVELLIDSGALKNNGIENSERYTLLHWLVFKVTPCQENHIKVGDILIRHNADVNAYDHKGETPLQYALQKGSTVWAEYLLKNGARVNDLKWNAGSLEFYMYKKSNVFSRNDMIKLLFKNGLDPAYKNEKNQNHLHILIENVSKYDCSTPDLVKILIDAGVPIDGVDNDGNTPLQCSLSKHSLRTISFISDKGADVNVKNKVGNTALHLAAAFPYERTGMVNFLLSNEAVVNARNNEGQTALHIACYRARTFTINLLVHKGADVTARTRSGATPLSIMFRFNNQYNFHDASICSLIKGFAKLSFDNIPIAEADMMLIRGKKKFKSTLRSV